MLKRNFVVSVRASRSGTFQLVGSPYRCSRAQLLAEGQERTMLYFELSDLELEDQERVRHFLQRRHRGLSSYTTESRWVGQKIWRPVDVMLWQGRLLKVPWDDLFIRDSTTQSDPQRPVKVLRAEQRNDGEWIATDADSSGLICFCYDPIPPDWTWFEVLKVHVLKSCWIVRPVVGDKDEHLRMF